VRVGSGGSVEVVVVVVVVVVGAAVVVVGAAVVVVVSERAIEDGTGSAAIEAASLPHALATIAMSAKRASKRRRISLW